MNNETTKAVFRPTSVPGLYQRESGSFFSRYSLNGKRTWRSLETDNFAAAKLKHAEKMSEVETARQAGITIRGDLRTMGALYDVMKLEVERSTLKEPSKISAIVRLNRLKKNWPGDFDSTLVRTVDAGFIAEFRNRMMKEGTFRRKDMKTSKAYTVGSINSTLGALKRLLEIATRNHVIAQNPFDETGIINGSLYLTPDTRRPELPSNADMERIFAEMERVPEAEQHDPSRVAALAQMAKQAADHARFLAYSGMRLTEAQTATLQDDLGELFHIRGTKSKSADRTIPVVPEFRALLDRLCAGKIGATTPILDVQTSRQAIARACERLGLPRLRHHDLRHYFTTVCVEAGVPIPTVADWLGHSDGGAMLSRVYRHLRDKHSLEAAKLVSFTGSAPAVRGKTG